MISEKPNYPARKNPEYYPFLIALGLTETYLKNCQVMEAAVVAVNSRTTVTVEYDTPTQTQANVPVWVPTDIGTREAIIRDTEAADIFDYFKNGGLMFPFKRDAGISAPRVLILTHLDDEENHEAIAVIQVLQVDSKAFPGGPFPTYGLYMLVEVAMTYNGQVYDNTSREYILYDMIEDCVASIPSYDVNKDPCLPFYQAIGVHNKEAIEDFLGSSITIPPIAEIPPDNWGDEGGSYFNRPYGCGDGGFLREEYWGVPTYGASAKGLPNVTVLDSWGSAPWHPNYDANKDIDPDANPLFVTAWSSNTSFFGAYWNIGTNSYSYDIPKLLLRGGNSHIANYIRDYGCHRFTYPYSRFASVANDLEHIQISSVSGSYSAVYSGLTFISSTSSSTYTETHSLTFNGVTQTRSNSFSMYENYSPGVSDIKTYGSFSFPINFIPYTSNNFCDFWIIDFIRVFREKINGVVTNFQAADYSNIGWCTPTFLIKSTNICKTIGDYMLQRFPTLPTNDIGGQIWDASSVYTGASIMAVRFHGFHFVPYDIKISLLRNPI